MRKSAAVTLTLVPMLAASALAYAQAPGETEPAAPEVGKPLPFEWSPGAPDDIDWTLAPPGLTPTIDQLDCDDDPNWALRTDCEGVEASDTGGGVGIGVVRGGFGHYFWTGGG